VYKQIKIGSVEPGPDSVLSQSSTQQRQLVSGLSIHGAWQLVSYGVEVKSNGLMFNPMGEKPIGHVIFTPEGRVSFTLTAENRQAPESVQDRADLFNSMIAYTGTYRLSGNQWVTRVDAAWNPQWVGTEQTRYFLIEGDKLVVQTPWRVMPNWPEKGLTRSIVCFQRCQGGFRS